MNFFYFLYFFNEAASTTSNNPRKRGREASVATTGITTPINHPFSLQQSQPPQLIDLSQLHNQSQPNVVSTGLRLSFGEQQQQQQLQQNQSNHNHHHHLHHQQQQQQQSQQLQQFNQSSLLSVMAEDFASQIKQQRDEIDQFLQAQVPILSLLKWVLIKI